MIEKSVVVLLALVSFSGLADTQYGDVVVDRVTSVDHADAIRVTIEDWPSLVGHRVSVGVKGIDVPELKGRCKAETLAAKNAKQATVAIVREATRIQLREMERGEYFQILADVYVDGVSLAKKLIEDGHARLYVRGQRESWCKKDSQDFSRGYKRFK